jgi:hypothetical protein
MRSSEIELLPDPAWSAGAAAPRRRDHDVRSDAPRKPSRWTTISFLILLAATVIIVLGLPNLLRTLPDPRPVRISTLTGQVSGAYVSAPRGLFKLYNYPELMKVLPNGAATTTAGTVILVRARLIDEQLDRYGLWTYPRHEAVPLQRRLVDDHTVRLIPRQPLPAGSYTITTARDSVDAGTDYFYFTVGKAGE